MKVFGERIKQLRMEKGLTGAELGEKFGISKSGVSNWEVRDREPSLEVLIGLSKFFEVSIDYLLGLTLERLPQKEAGKLLSVKLINRLINSNAIEDPDNIPSEIIEMIILAFKNDVKAIKKN